MNDRGQLQRRKGWNKIINRNGVVGGGGGGGFLIVTGYGEVQRVESEQDSMSGLCRASAAVEANKYIPTYLIKYSCTV